MTFNFESGLRETEGSNNDVNNIIQASIYEMHITALRFDTLFKILQVLSLAEFALKKRKEL